MFGTDGTLADGISGLSCCTLINVSIKGFQFRGVSADGYFIFNPLCLFLRSLDVCHDVLVDVRLVRGVCGLRFFSLFTTTASPIFSVCFLVLCRLSWYSLHFSLKLRSFALTSWSLICMVVGKWSNFVLIALHE